MTRRSTSLRAFQAATDADRDGERHRDEQGRQRERQRRLEPLRDQPGDREVGEDRDAEVALCQAPQPDRELLDHRPVEPELGAHRGDRFAGRVVAGDDRRRIARREAQQKKTNSATTAITGMTANRRRMM
jgi:hypothetical protein